MLINVSSLKVKLVAGTPVWTISFRKTTFFSFQASVQCRRLAAGFLAWGWNGTTISSTRYCSGGKETINLPNGTISGGQQYILDLK
jgi:hypothetical protein